MKPFLRAALLLGGASMLLGGDCVFGRPIVDERGRYFPSDGVISCTGTRCADLPAYELDLPAREDSPCAEDLPAAELTAAVQAGTSLSGMRYLLESEGPLEISLGVLDIRDACLVLSGPVRLTLAAGSTLTRVTVMFGRASPSDHDAGVRPSARATPNLYLGHAELDRVTLQAREEHEPSGSAQIEFSTCVQCETSIDALTVTESHAAQGPSACNGITISQTTFLAGMIDGKIHAENSAFRSVLFARHAPTSLDMWNVDVGLSVMCDQQVDVRLDARSGIACTSCDTVETVTACRLDNAPELIANPCRAFEGKLRACEPPLPARRSPYVTMPPRLGK